jgi:hypothetical protein
MVRTSIGTSFVNGAMVVLGRCCGEKFLGGQESGAIRYGCVSDSSARHANPKRALRQVDQRYKMEILAEVHGDTSDGATM